MNKSGRELRGVFGIPALSSTAYGNVDSSICYALDPTARYGDAPPIITQELSCRPKRERQ